MVAPRILSVLLVFALAGCGSLPRGPADIVFRGSSDDRDVEAGADATSTRTASVRTCGRTYTVRQGDGLSSISRLCNVSMSALAAENGLSTPYSLSPGQVLRMPAPDTYVVQPGQNLYRIALAHGMSVEELAQLNNLDQPYTIYPGQELLVTGDTNQLTFAQTENMSESQLRIESVPPSQTTATRRSDSAPAENGPDFMLPLRGELLSSFGPQSSGTRKDGWTIAASFGDLVRASADGEVVYAGNELQGYGELILIRHAGNWVTAYAHNARITVAVGDQIERGDVIAEAGSTGNAERPQLYFEIRQGVRPVDPAGFLSRPS